MNAILAFAGPFFMPVTQIALWVLNLRSRASVDTDVDTAAQGGAAATATPDFLAAAGTNLNQPGAFPQVSQDFIGYAGTTDWEVDLADPAINAPTTLSSAFARKSSGGDWGDYGLLVHAVVSDNNGLTVPQLEQAAMDSLALAERYFQSPATTDISVDFISANSAQIQWSGTLADGQEALYFPLALETVDRAGFTEQFNLQVPILSDDFSG